MKVKVVTCLITLGKMTTVPKSVPLWEAEVLDEMYGGSCEVTDDISHVDRPELPDAGAEYGRLQDAYPPNPDTNENYVERAFGRGKRGVKELDRQMKKAVVKTRKPAAPKPAVVPKPTKVVKEDIDPDNGSEPDPLK